MNWVAAREACKSEIERHQERVRGLHHASEEYQRWAIVITTLQSLYMILHAGTTTPVVSTASRGCQCGCCKAALGL